MTLHIQKFLLLLLLSTSCNTSTGALLVIGDISNGLTEVSAVETIPNSNLLWVIEDSGNQNNLYGLNTQGDIIKDIDISNAENEDWEDLTSDSSGNIYIGDFGNNNEKRKDFTIYKVLNPDKSPSSTQANIINFELPKGVDSKNFESFFLFNNYFYLFSKGRKKSVLIKVPNQIGSHTAELVTEFTLDGKDTKVTSADISDDGKTIVLLNQDKLWKLTNFESDQFFNGTIEALPFDHNSQKEGICFRNHNSVYITDEKNGMMDGNNIYVFNLD
ncbi:MAG: hypothetical protein ACM31G_03375 [Flavobacteriales bacterium]